MLAIDTADRPALATRYEAVRSVTERLADPLSPEDQCIQPMPDASPTKWHRAHTTWFFETFLLRPHLPGYEVFEPMFEYLYNSYYEGVGARHPRAERGLISRPSVADVAYYRHHVDAAMGRLLTRLDEHDRRRDLVELGIHHEQQHQELLLMDIEHVLWKNPLRPAYAPFDRVAVPTSTQRAGWLEHDGGIVEVGHRNDGFAFDNESPAHEVLLTPFAVADHLVTVGEWEAFMDDGGYERPELWLSDGWAWANEHAIDAPLYWFRSDDAWYVHTLHGSRPVAGDEPVVHVSHYEADAYARWAGARLPTEFEWEAIAPEVVTGRVFDDHLLQPIDHPGGGWFGEVWQWTASPYVGYPGFEPAPGAVGEYNGKFMSNQMVLRGSACVTPRDHARCTYRNFYPPAARWSFGGLRLARESD